jgi:hypothetical protein
VTNRKRTVESVHVYRDRVVVWHNVKNLGVRLLLTPWDIGHMTFERLGTLRVWFGAPDVDEKPFVPLRLGSRRTDHRDALLRQLAAMSEKQVCSFEEGDGRVRYSRTWSITDLFPWQEMVTTAWLHPDLGEGTSAETTARHYPVTRRSGYSLHFSGKAGHVFLARVDRERIYLHNGMVVGFVMEGRHIRFGSGEDVTIDARDGEVQIDGKPGGRLSNEGHALKLELDEPQPELFPLVVLLAFAEGTRSTVV